MLGPSVPLTRPPISELFSPIRESNVIQSSCDYSFDPFEHHNAPLDLNDASIDLVRPSLVNTDIDISEDSHRGSTVRQIALPFDKSVDPRVRRLKARRLTNRKKNLPTNGWRLSDVEFDKLNSHYHFNVEGCCDPSGFKQARHRTLLF